MRGLNQAKVFYICAPLYLIIFAMAYFQSESGVIGSAMFSIMALAMAFFALILSGLALVAILSLIHLFENLLGDALKWIQEWFYR